MRILFLVTRSDTIGGSHIHVRDLAIALSNDGHEAVVGIGGNGPIIDHFNEKGIQTEVIPDLDRSLNPLRDFRAYRQICILLHRFKPDLVSVHSSKAGFLGRIAASRNGFPALFTAHGWSFTDGKRSLSRFLYKQLERVVLPFTDKIITVSEYDRELAIKQFKLSSDKIRTIHNGMPDIKTVQDRDAFFDPDKVHLAMVARFDHQKDHSELLEALKGMSHIHLHLVGDGPLMPEVQKEASRLGLEKQIKYWGRVDDVSGILAKCDIFVLISNWEGFPRSTLEAMRGGLPVIVSDVGGAAEAVEEGINGYVVQKGDIEYLRKVIMKLAKNADLRNKMGASSRARYLDRYTFQKMYERTLAVYQDLLKN